MKSESNIDAIAANVTETITALKRYRTEGSGHAFTEYRDAVAAIAAYGRPIDPQSLNRILIHADVSAETLESDIYRAKLISQDKAAEIEASQIAAACAPIMEEHRRGEAVFLAAEKAWRETSEELNAQIDRLRAPLRQHETIRRELRQSEAPRPASLQTNWGDITRQLSNERLRIQHPISDPTGSPDCTPGRVELWLKEEAARAARLVAIDRQLAVFRRAEELVREMYLCPVTGLWDQLADANRCLERARQEIAAAEAAQLAAKRTTAIEAEQAEEAAADKSKIADLDIDAPGSISTLFASVNESVA